MKNQKFQVHQWCFFNYNLVEVMVSDETGVHAVVGFNFSHYSAEDLSSRCFAFHPQLISFAKECEKAESHFADLAMPYSNHVIVRDYISEFWDKMCAARDEPNKLSNVQKEFNEWILSHMKLVTDIFTSKANHKEEPSRRVRKIKSHLPVKGIKKTVHLKTSKR